jgi:hypothetical protein
MGPLRKNVPAWEGGRTLDLDGIRLRVNDEPPRLLASRGGQELWRSPLPGPGYVIGATEEDVLMVIPPDRLEVIARSNGQRRTTIHHSALFDPLEKRPSPCQWIGHAGRRAYWLITRTREWLVRIPEVVLAVFDGQRVRIYPPRPPL